MTHSIHAEIDRNFDFFQRHVGSYIPTEKGRFALLRNAGVVSFFSTPREAERAGEQEFPDQLYSIQEVTAEPADLGFFTHAFDNG